MRFLTLISRNLFRRRARTLLTATGLAVAIAAVLDLVGIAWSFERSFLTLFVGKGIDLVVVRAGTSNQLSSALDQKLGDGLRAMDGVAEVAPSLMDTVGFEQAHIASALVNGWESGSLLFRGSQLLEGRTFRPGEGNVALLGRVLALNLGKKVGDDLDIAGEAFRVIGVYESNSLFESGALIVPLSDAAADDGPRRPGHGLCHPVPIARSGCDRGASKTNRGRNPRRCRHPGQRLRAARRSAPARQGDGLGHDGTCPDCSGRSACSTR